MVLSYTIESKKKTVTVLLSKPVSYWRYFAMKRKVESDGVTRVKIIKLFDGR